MNNMLKASIISFMVVGLLASCTPASSGASSDTPSTGGDTATAEMSLNPSPERIAFLQDDVRDGYPKRAPWQDINWTGTNETEILLSGTWYDFESIDGISEADLLDFAQLVYEHRWQKRIAEDLVAVMTHMDRAPGSTVALALVDQSTGQSVLKTVAMTEDNRWDVWDARNARGE